MCVDLSPAPPLTVENIVKEVEGMRDAYKLWQWLNGEIPLLGLSFTSTVRRFLQGRGYFLPSWRAVILALDGAGETRLANRIRDYAEPVQGRYMLCD
jgi:hypothetical protein